jgi:DNA-binding CsgD family transcriptional regulator
MSLCDGAGREDVKIGRIVELALASPDRRWLHEQVLDFLEGAVGFDKGSLSSCDESGSRTCTRGYDRVAAFEDLDRYMNELDTREIAVALNGKPIVDLDVLSAQRRDRLALYHEFLRPEAVSVFTTVMWRSGHSAHGITLARTRRGARFAAGELRALESLLPAIQLADAYVSSRQREAAGEPFDAWARASDLTAKEREVAALVVRGLTNGEIAGLLGVSRNTIRNQLASVFRKAAVSTRAELVFVATTSALCPHDRAALHPHWLTRIATSPRSPAPPHLEAQGLLASKGRTSPMQT